jgi:hypothetical protein
MVAAAVSRAISPVCSALSFYVLGVCRSLMRAAAPTSLLALIARAARSRCMPLLFAYVSTGRATTFHGIYSGLSLVVYRTDVGSPRKNRNLVAGVMNLLTVFSACSCSVCSYASAYSRQW